MRNKSAHNFGLSKAQSTQGRLSAESIANHPIPLPEWHRAINMFMTVIDECNGYEVAKNGISLKSIPIIW